MLSQRRAVNLAGGLACLAMFAYALFEQFHEHLDPCPLCIFQRITVVALGLVFLVAAAHNPRGRATYVYAALIALAALATIGVAGRHVYIQSQPAGSVPACGAPLDVLMQMFPVSEVIAKVLHGGGECAVVNWTLLGITMPGWVLICAVILGGVGVVANVRRDKPARAEPYISAPL